MSFAKVSLMGNLGRDPELRYTPQGTPVCDFSMATTEKFTKGGEKQEKTLWWKVTCWGKMAETAGQYLSKGRPVYIEGRPGTDTWTDREGKEHTDLTVNATDLQFIPEGGRQDEGGSNRGQQQSRQAPRQSGPPNSGGRPLGPKEQARQARENARTDVPTGGGGGLSLDDDDKF